MPHYFKVILQNVKDTVTKLLKLLLFNTKTIDSVQVFFQRDRVYINTSTLTDLHLPNNQATLGPQVV